MPTPKKSYTTDRGRTYQEYINSAAWAKLKRTMPGPKMCVACGSTEGLHLHHMYYPEDIYKTKHFHCCWLCIECHNSFHKRVRGNLPLPSETWRILLKETIRLCKSAQFPKYKKHHSHPPQIKFPKGRALAPPNVTGWVVVSAKDALAERIARDRRHDK